MHDPLNVLLKWTGEEGDRKTREDDSFAGEDNDEPELQAGTVEVNAPQEQLLGEADFEWTEDRMQAIEAALERLGPAPSSRVVGLLRQLLAQPDTAKLDSVEAWLKEQIPAWQSPVREVDEQDEESAEHFFNRGVSAGADGIFLALEVVELIRQGQPAALSEKLIDQVDDFFQKARHRLLATEPDPDQEPPPEPEPEAVLLDDEEEED